MIQEKKDKINGILSGYFSEEIKPELTLKDDIGLDSLDMVELVMSLENEFDITITDNEIDSEELKTVRDLYDFIERKLN